MNCYDSIQGNLFIYKYTCTDIENVYIYRHTCIGIFSVGIENNVIKWNSEVKRKKRILKNIERNWNCIIKSMYFKTLCVFFFLQSLAHGGTRLL